MFVGKAKHTISKNGRVSIPSKMRDVIKNKYKSEDEFEDESEDRPDDLYLILMPRNIICLYPEKEFDQLVSGLYNPDGESLPDVMNTQRLCGEAESCKLDGSGRIVIPPEMKQRAKIRSEVLVVGANTHIEIWDPDRWEFNQDQIRAGMERLMILSTQPSVSPQDT